MCGHTLADKHHMEMCFVDGQFCNEKMLTPSLIKELKNENQGYGWERCKIGSHKTKSAKVNIEKSQKTKFDTLRVAEHEPQS